MMRQETFRRYIINASLLYLLLPNILFLLGWVRPYLAIPSVVLTGYAVLKVCIKKERKLENIQATPFTTADCILYSLMLLVLVGVTEFIGFHAHVRQDPDFTYRNAIYATLVCQDWPIFSERGEYFIYYHAFWLPPALFSKWVGNLIDPISALAVWSYIGLALGSSLIYFSLRRRTILFFAILTLTSSVSYCYCFFHSQKTDFISNYLLCADNHFYLLNFFLHQLRCTFNHAIPGFLFLALSLTGSIPMRYMLVPSALLFSLSPMCGLASLPLLSVLFYCDWQKNRCIPLNIPSLLVTLPVGITLLYLCGQQSDGNTSFCLMWNESPFWINKSETFTHLHWRLLNTLILCLSFLLPIRILLGNKLRSSPLFTGLVITTVLVTFVWIGRLNNELMFKGSLVLAVIQAYLLTQQWAEGSGIRKAMIILFILAFLKFDMYAYMPIAKTYSIKNDNAESNRCNAWQWSLDHPEQKQYKNFFGTNRCPVLLNDKQGEGNFLLPAHAGSTSLFSDN